MADDDETDPTAAPRLLTVGVVDLDELALNLDKAFLVFQDEPRKGLGQAILALKPVLEAADPDRSRGHRLMFSELADALIDLDRGQQPELLSRRKTPHRPKQPVGLGLMRANAARLADLLEMAGMPSDEANRKVAQLLRGCGFEVGGRNNPRSSSTVIARWRSDLAAGRGPPEGVVAYEHLKSRTRAIPPSKEPSEARRELVETFRVLLTSQRTGDLRAVADLSKIPPY